MLLIPAYDEGGSERLHLPVANLDHEWPTGPVDHVEQRLPRVQLDFFRKLSLYSTTTRVASV